MTKPFTEYTAGYEVTEHIYVKADGRTVCKESDPAVDSLKHAKGERITKGQCEALIFPDAAKPEPLPESNERSAEVIPDAEKRRGRKPVG